MGGSCCTPAMAVAPMSSQATVSRIENLDVDIAATTDIGGPGKKENQDVFLVEKEWMGIPHRHLWGVIDGHGVEGRALALACKQSLGMVLDSLYEPSTHEADIEKMLWRTFGTVHTALSNKKNGFNARFSGATCTLGLLERRNMTIAFVGDSQALLVTQPQTGVPLQQAWLSRCHQFTEQDEKDRVINAGGVVQRSKGAGDNGPLRAYFQGELYPGLMVSRSLGDTDAHSIGVSAVPDFFHHTIGPHDRHLIVCSDGVWDVLSVERVIHIVASHPTDPEAASRDVVKEARREWSKRPRCDNITCLVVNFYEPDSAVSPSTIASDSKMACTPDKYNLVGA